MEKGSRLEAFRLAITNEKKEKEFYLENAARTADPLGKGMFESIAADEDQHYRRLLDLAKRYEERSKWPEGFSIDISASKVAEVIGRLIKGASPAGGGDAKDVEAVRIAIEFETKGEAFYSDLAAKAENKHEKRFFTMLASMEREHRLSLEDTLEYLTDPQGWFERKEGRSLDGA